MPGIGQVLACDWSGRAENQCVAIWRKAHAMIIVGAIEESSYRLAPFLIYPLADHDPEVGKVGVEKPTDSAADC